MTTDQSRPDVPVEPVTEAGRRLREDKSYHGISCMAFALRGATPSGESGPLPEPCACGLSDRILAIEAEARTPAADAARLAELRAAVEALHRWDVSRGWTAFNATLARIDAAFMDTAPSARQPVED